MPVKQLFIWLLLAGITFSCVDPFWPDIDKYENVLVVDGRLTNTEDTVMVKLSYSSPLNNEERITISSASLFIQDDKGEVVYFTETRPGTYIIPDLSFHGVAGTKYQLHIALENGKHYQSDMELLTESAPIDSVYGVVKTEEVAGYDHDLQGVQFYVDNHNSLTDTAYYLWRCDQTYEYMATFTLDVIWMGYPIYVSRPDSLRRCWRTKPDYSLYTYTTKNLDQPVIKQFPITYATTETKMLSIRYSLRVEQYSIDEKAYEFFDALRQQNLEQGSLYARQPIQIRGNVFNTDDPGEPVLGYFTVAGVSTKRIFINRPSGLEFYYSVCQPDFESVTMIGASSPAFWPIYLTDVPGMGWAMGASDVCFDCRLEGGALTPPDFWTLE